MAGAIINARRPELNVVTAGTLSVNGQPISFRTREALKHIGLEAQRHRSQQIEHHHVQAADLIIALAPEHVEWIRRNFPHVAHRTSTLKRLTRHLEHDGPFMERVAALNLATVELEPWEEVVDPGGGEVEDFINCAVEVVALMDDIMPRLGCHFYSSTNLAAT